MPLSKTECVALATRIISTMNSALAQQFASITDFVAPSFKSAKAKRGHKGSIEDYVAWLATEFLKGRSAFEISVAGTKPDKVVDIILSQAFDMPIERASQVAKEHQASMMAENAVGDLLERYLAAQLEPLGWVWCSGSVVTAVDFLKPKVNGKPVLLQCKNRHNSENSSSSKVRDHTAILKWFRYNSKNGSYHWEGFPDAGARKSLSEEGFRSFVAMTVKEAKERLASN